MDATATEVIRLYGYPKDQDIDSPLSMVEVTIAADPGSLRNLAAFLNYAAEQLERHGDQFGHEHYSDFLKTRSVGFPEITVSHP